MSKINLQSKILIAGAGPAGASLAIRLANKGFRVTLLEREKFPRQKLCGEFISPECLRHFKDLGVLDAMLSTGSERISETIFYAINGKSVGVPSYFFGDFEQNAVGLSRAEMDFRLLEKAKNVGVEVLEETQVNGLFFENEKIRAVKVRGFNNKTAEIEAGFFIDATGRAAVLANFAEKHKGQNSKIKGQRSKLVGFKTHLKNVNLEKGVCEIYFFRGGYGGLNFVENDLGNHCFLIQSEIVKKYGGNADAIVENVIFENLRAKKTLGDAVKVYDWLAVSVDGFGKKNLQPFLNLISIGDAGAFIDPFTGSGMLMALESSEILADILANQDFSFDEIGENYKVFHKRKFQKRLRVCAVMRRLAFMPKLADAAVSLLSFGKKPREILARATRSV